MSLGARVLPLVVFAAGFVAACADVSSTTRAVSRPASALASKGGGSGGGGGGGTGTTTQLVVTTPPTVNASGKWVGTSDGPDVTHTYTFNLGQSNDGIVTGSGSSVTPFQTASYAVVGTVNADTVMLYVGTLSCGCTLTPLYLGIEAPDGTLIDGKFLNGGVSPVTLYKQ